MQVHAHGSSNRLHDSHFSDDLPIENVWRKVVSNVNAFWRTFRRITGGNYSKVLAALTTHLRATMDVIPRRHRRVFSHIDVSSPLILHVLVSTLVCVGAEQQGLYAASTLFVYTDPVTVMCVLCVGVCMCFRYSGCVCVCLGCWCVMDPCGLMQINT